MIEDTTHKPTQIAQQEILQDLIEFKIPEMKKVERK